MENKRTETNKTVQKRLEPELKLINMDTVEVEQIEWLLYPFIPYGKVTIIQGDPGEGKTTMVLQIIAKLTKGETILPADSTKDKRIDIDSESDMVDAENIENNSVFATLVTLVLGTGLGFLSVQVVVKTMNPYFYYSFPWLIVLIYLAILLIVQFTLISYTTGNLKKQSLVEQIRTME